MECGDPRFAVQKSVRELRRAVPSQDSFEDDSTIHLGLLSKTAVPSQNGTTTSERVQRIQSTLRRLLQQDLSSPAAISESLADFRTLWQASRYTPNKAERTLVASAFTEAGFLQLFEKVWQLSRGGLWCGGSLCLASHSSIPLAAAANSSESSAAAAKATNSISPAVSQAMGCKLSGSIATDSSESSSQEDCRKPLGSLPNLCHGPPASEKLPSDSSSLSSQRMSSSMCSSSETRKQPIGSKPVQKSLDEITTRPERGRPSGSNHQDTSKTCRSRSSSAQSSCRVSTPPASPECQTSGCGSKGRPSQKSPESIPSSLNRGSGDAGKGVGAPPLPRDTVISDASSAPAKADTSSRGSAAVVSGSTKALGGHTSPDPKQVDREKMKACTAAEKAPHHQEQLTPTVSPSGNTAKKETSPKSSLPGSEKCSPSESHGKTTEKRVGDRSPQKESHSSGLSPSGTSLQPPPSEQALGDLSLDSDSVSQWKVLRNCLTILWNCSDVNAELGRSLAESELIPEFLQALRLLLPDSIKGLYGDRKLYFIKALLGILHNTLRLSPETRSCIRAAGGVETLQGILAFNPQTIKAKALIVLSYIVDEEEVGLIGATVDMITFIVHLLRDSLQMDTHFSAKYGMCTSETLQALNNLSGNDGNKIQIVEAGALPLFTQLLVSGMEVEQELSVLGLWSLAFASGNRQRLAEEPGCVDGLQNLTKSGNVAICHAARGALWEIFHGGDISKSLSVPGASDTPHVMVSYQWDAQPIMVKVKDKLKQAGFKVWMDVEHMTGSTLEAMALAVERAAVVLICMSEKYKESPSCRTESEYTFRLRKQIVPLRVQSRYVPDGWLGMLVGSKLYFDFSKMELIDKNMPRLIRELGDRGRISSLRTLYCDGDSQHITPYSSKVSSPLQEAPAAAVPACNRWGADDVGNWLVRIGLGDYSDRFRSLDGALVMEMRDMRDKAPDFLYATLRADFNMSLGDILVLSRALSSLQ